MVSLPAPLPAICTAALGTVLVTAAAAAAPFSDVSEDDWASPYIEKLAAAGILQGFPDGRFRPGATVTRAQWAALLRQAFFPSASGDNAPAFADVPGSHWGTTAIQAARSSDFLAGYPGNRFYPERPVSRVQALVALASGLDYAMPDTGVLGYYTDWRTLPEYALGAVAGATEAGIVVSYPDPNQLRPNQAATRADVAALIYQSLVQTGQAEPLSPAPYAVNPQGQAWAPPPRAIIPVAARHIDLDAAGEHLLAVQRDPSQLQVWSLSQAAIVVEIPLPDSPRLPAAISPDGTRVAVVVPDTTGARLQIWQVATGTVLGEQSLGSGAAVRPQVTFAPDGQTLLTYVESDDGSSQLRLHDSATGAVRQTLPPPQAGIRQFAFSPSGQLLAGAGRVSQGNRRQPEVQLWDLQRGERRPPLTDFGDDFSPVDVVFNPAGQLLVLRRQLYQNRFDQWDVRSGERLQQLTDIPALDRQDRLHRLSPDGDTYFVRSDVAGTRLISLSRRTVRELPVYAADVAFNAQGSWVAIATQEAVHLYSR